MMNDDVEYHGEGAYSPMKIHKDATTPAFGSTSPAALLAEYPALRNNDWSRAPDNEDTDDYAPTTMNVNMPGFDLGPWAVQRPQRKRVSEMSDLSQLSGDTLIPPYTESTSGSWPDTCLISTPLQSPALTPKPQMDIASFSSTSSGRLANRRASTSSVNDRDYMLDLADPGRPGAAPSTGNSSRVQKYPATFQCHLCSKKFTLAYSLRSHLWTHTDERPFVCTVCGKAFARQHDRKRHEGSAGAALCHSVPETVFCQFCDESPEGFGFDGEHELRGHVDHHHEEGAARTVREHSFVHQYTQPSVVGDHIGSHHVWDTEQIPERNNSQIERAAGLRDELPSIVITATDQDHPIPDADSFQASNRRSTQPQDRLQDGVALASSSNNSVWTKPSSVTTDQVPIVQPTDSSTFVDQTGLRSIPASSPATPSVTCTSGSDEMFGKVSNIMESIFKSDQVSENVDGSGKANQVHLQQMCYTLTDMLLDAEGTASSGDMDPRNILEEQSESDQAVSGELDIDRSIPDQSVHAHSMSHQPGPNIHQRLVLAELAGNETGGDRTGTQLNDSYGTKQAPNKRRNDSSDAAENDRPWKKRRRRGKRYDELNGDDDDEDDGDEDINRSLPQSDRRNMPSRGRPFACPCWKRDPLEYTRCHEWKTNDIDSFRRHIEDTHSKSLTHVSERFEIVRKTKMAAIDKWRAFYQTLLANEESEADKGAIDPYWYASYHSAPVSLIGRSLAACTQLPSSSELTTITSRFSTVLAETSRSAQGSQSSASGTYASSVSDLGGGFHDKVRLIHRLVEECEASEMQTVRQRWKRALLEALQRLERSSETTPPPDSGSSTTPPASLETLDYNLPNIADINGGLEPFDHDMGLRPPAFLSSAQPTIDLDRPEPTAPNTLPVLNTADPFTWEYQDPTPCTVYLPVSNTNLICRWCRTEVDFHELPPLVQY